MNRFKSYFLRKECKGIMNIDNIPAINISEYFKKRNLLDQYYISPKSSDEYNSSIIIANEMIEKIDNENQLSYTGINYIKQALNQEPFSDMPDEVKDNLLDKAIKNCKSLIANNIFPDDFYFAINIDTYYQRFSRSIILNSGCKDSLALNPLANNDDLLLTAMMCKIKTYISDEEIHRVLITHFDWDDWLKRIVLALCIVYKNASKLSINFEHIVNQVKMITEDDEMMIEKIIYKNYKDNIEKRINDIILNSTTIWKIVFK